MNINETKNRLSSQTIERISRYIKRINSYVFKWFSSSYSIESEFNI